MFLDTRLRFKCLARSTISKKSGAVTVIWADSAFWASLFPNLSDMGIPRKPNRQRFGLGLGLGLEGMPMSLARVLGMGMPKTRGCPYHYDRDPVLITKNKLQSTLALGTPPYNGLSLLRAHTRCS